MRLNVALQVLATKVTMMAYFTLARRIVLHGLEVCSQTGFAELHRQ
jgi:hypothetical protein